MTDSSSDINTDIYFDGTKRISSSIQNGGANKFSLTDTTDIKEKIKNIFKHIKNNNSENLN
jgi:hypothetical protein